MTTGFSRRLVQLLLLSLAPWLQISTLASPALAPGDLLIASADRFGAIDSGGIVLVDPSTAAQTLIVSSSVVGQAEDMVVGPKGLIYVASSGSPSVPAGIYRVDPVTGGATRISGANGTDLAASPSRLLYLTGGPQFACVQVIKSIDAKTGASRVVSFGGDLGCVQGLFVDASGVIYVSVRSSSLGPAVVRVDPASGAQTIVASGGLLKSPHDLVKDSSGDLLVETYDVLSDTYSVVRVNGSTGAQSFVAFVPCFDSEEAVNGLAIDPVGRIYAGCRGSLDPAADGSIWCSSLGTTPCAPSGFPGGFLVDPSGIAVVP